MNESPGLTAWPLQAAEERADACTQRRRAERLSAASRISQDRIDVGHEGYTINRFDVRMKGVHHPVIVGQPDIRMTCSHVEAVRNVQPSAAGCDDCVILGDVWLQLRMCMECGYVGCCDSSRNKHAIGHFRATQHPIARSIEPGEEWAWCYVDKLWFERLVLP